ncbi:MAG: methionyl-tRNA formyltransferase [Proteobacteria bacterium]|nr:methionyl-tRNA formyltransferase [Pseudomonadota bacterium]
MKICIVVDNPRSWFVPFAEELKKNLSRFGSVDLLSDSNQISQSNDVAFLLSCEKKVIPEILRRSRSNIVVHASELPKGKGMSPLTWQILEGKNRIPITLFEAVEAIDAGPVYIIGYVDFIGNELLHEMQNSVGVKIMEMCETFLNDWPQILSNGIAQNGEPSFYKKRTPGDSRLDPQKSLSEQFNL